VLSPALPARGEPLGEATSRTDIELNTESPLVGKNMTSSLGATQEFAEVIPFGRGRGGTANVPVVAAGTSAENSDEIVREDLDEGADLLDGLRRLRDSRESDSRFTPMLEVVNPANAVEDEPDDAAPADSESSRDFDETTVWIDADDEVFVDEDVTDAPNLADAIQDADEQVEPEEDGHPASNPKRSRAAMPSWDEIVFGTRPDNKES
jgi:hypothetical protein